jgi:quinol monooxygenase YgiN
MIFLNVLLTVKEESEIPAIAAALTRAGRLSAAEPGCHRWEAYHVQSDASQFLLVEQWESEEALAAHRLAEAYTTIYAVEVIPKVDRLPLRSDRLI